MTREAHRQTSVRVNARVDEGMAGLVSALSALPWIETVDSCKGERGRDGWPASVCFSCGD